MHYGEVFNISNEQKNSDYLCYNLILGAPQRDDRGGGGGRGGNGRRDDNDRY